MPSAKQLTYGGFFPVHSEGLWDTPEAAKLVLHGLMTHHESQLESMMGAEGSTSLAELAKRGLADIQGGDVATQMALDVKDGLYAQNKVRLAVIAYGMVKTCLPICGGVKALVYQGALL